MSEESEVLTSLGAMYSSAGWKHFEKYIDDRIQLCVDVIMNPETPEEEIEKVRMVAFALNSLKDKVSADKQNIEINTSQETE
jgi:hypothetical protein